MKLIYKYPGHLAFLWALVIFILCATPGRYIPSASWLELLSFDKFVHAGIFFVLCGLLILYTIKRGLSGYFLLVFFLMAVAYGCLLEWMQANYFSERSADWHDIVANTTGCIFALLFFKRFGRLYTRFLASN